MDGYNIYRSERFNKKFSNLDNSIMIRIEKEIENIKNNPRIGKPLGYKFFRERKVGVYRVYYLIYEEYIVVLLVGISKKIDQQKIINEIRDMWAYYKEFVKRKLRH